MHIGRRIMTGPDRFERKMGKTLYLFVQRDDRVVVFRLLETGPRAGAWDLAHYF